MTSTAEHFATFTARPDAEALIFTVCAPSVVIATVTAFAKRLAEEIEMAANGVDLDSGRTIYLWLGPDDVAPRPLTIERKSEGSTRDEEAYSLTHRTVLEFVVDGQVMARDTISYRMW